MKSAYKYAYDILRFEGGYVDDPDDPGGATNFGVTLRTLRSLGLDIDGSGRIDKADVRSLSKEHAIKIFVDEYFLRPKINMLPEVIQHCVFDMMVNSGNRAIKILQQVCTLFDEPLNADGVIGPNTIQASHRVEEKAGGLILDAYAIERRNFYFDLADRRPVLRKFAKTRAGGKGGWIVRSEAFMSSKFHMTASEFQERTRTWG